MNKKIICFLIILFVIIAVIGINGSVFHKQNQTKQNEIHVAVDGDDKTGKGTKDAPFATVSVAAKKAPGSIVVVHEGDYGPVKLGPECSGIEKVPMIIRPAKDDKVVIHANSGAGISLTNVSDITIEGLEIEGGTHGIFYQSTRNAEQTMNNITIKDCVVHGVRGTHGICAYARNDKMPVRNFTIEGCEVYDCECGSSESVVLNGNIDGFSIKNNAIHDNNNIGIDMIGFEGTAKHPDKSSGKKAYEADMVRNGVCEGNVVYNISTQGNKAYCEDGEYDRCAGGIYVDGGQNIEIFNNFIFNCDIGLEVATEHKSSKNKPFRVSGIHVHDNVIADCTGWAGICFGGYDKDRGLTEECAFDHNTMVDNAVQIGVQRSRHNHVNENLIIGGETAVEFNEDCSKNDLVNDISVNAACEIEDEDSWISGYGKMYKNRAMIADDFRSLIDGIGSGFVPDGKLMELYKN